LTVFLTRPNMLNKCFMKPVGETKPSLVIYQRENIMKQKTHVWKQSKFLRFVADKDLTAGVQF